MQAQDIYFDPNYGKLYEHIENGIMEIYTYEDEDGGIVSNQFIKREIPNTSLNEKYYDIITPYGYGGPIILQHSKDDNKLVKKYEEAFLKYAKENKIVSEFVRFHPVINNAVDFKEVYHPIYMRKTLGTNLTYEEPITIDFSKSCRKTIRQVLKSGVSYEIIQSPEDFTDFKRVYYSNMDRKNATDYYYFGDEYFELIKKYYKNNVILVKAIYEEKVIAAGLYFVYNNIIHIHLSGTDTEYLHLSPAYILKYATALWGKEHGYKTIHYGGGLTNSPEDTLYLFKRKFAQTTDFDFYIGKKVWNEEIYDKLCELKKADKNGEYFPAYRN